MSTATNNTPAVSLLDRFSGDRGADSAAAWRGSLPEVARRGITDQLIETVDELSRPVRRRVLHRWQAALRAGVFDESTLQAIAEVVADNR